jgi:ATP-binding cassette subfamily B protein
VDEPEPEAIMSFPLYRQLDAMDCGPACLRMVAAYHGKQFLLPFLRERSYIDKEGVSAKGIVTAAESIGLRTLVVKLPFDTGAGEEVSFLDVPLPCIVHWDQRHFVIVFKIGKKHIWIADPAEGKKKISHAEFKRHWCADSGLGVAILLETSPEFYNRQTETERRGDFNFLLQYVRPYRHLVGQLFVGLIFASIIQFLFPFITQAIVDTGIENQDLHFIWLMLIAQIVLLVGMVMAHFIQNWILLHIGARVNVGLVSDFLERIMRQPISFFDAKMTGDLLQRIADHKRIEDFLTVRTLVTIFSSFNLVVFGIVLAIYSLQIFFIFLVFSVLYLGWISLFMKKRLQLDHVRFKVLSENQSALVELIQGMQEIKLQNSERKRRFGWVHVQAKLFRTNIRMLALSTWQDTGGNLFIHLNDFIITAVAAISVIKGQMTLGMMLGVLYIIGQIQVPLQQIYLFIKSAQDAKLSLARLREIHRNGKANNGDSSGMRLASLPDLRQGPGFVIENLYFRYNELSDFVLKNINLEIPVGKLTAIVGESGSGKTTLVKLLLGFYEPTQGSIRIGNTFLKSMPPHLWRAKCGAVMQDGYVFSDTIASNIAESDGDNTLLDGKGIDTQRLLQSVQVAHIQEFIESLPLSYNTMVGARGNGLSQGQRQRLLIARAVYKEPEFLFFDEATNALDAHTEKIITENLQKFFAGRTVIVVAHRLSTVKNADQIVVLDKGEIVERGTHEELSGKKGTYYHLVKEQLELGS